MTRALLRRAALAAALLAAAPLLRPPAVGAAEGGAAGLVEKEFRDAIKVVTPATVVCVVPTKKQFEEQSTSSGVIVTKSGYVLSDGDAGAVIVGPPGANRRKDYREPVDVRIPDLKRGTYSVYQAKVVRRVPEIDSCLLKIANPPSSGFPFVPPRTSDGLHVGSFTFAMGTPFGHDEDGGAALTAGIVASLTPAPPNDPGGRWLEVYTSAAVNPGVNGGPLVDADGTLVGIISTWGQPEPANPFQFIGKAFPIDRIKTAYKDLPEFSAVFPDPKTMPTKSKQADLLERAFASVARTAYPSVASLVVERSEPLAIPLFRDRFGKGTKGPDGKDHFFPRYTGPVSAVIISPDGWLVAPLYGLADLFSLAYPGAVNDIEDQLATITKVTAHVPGGPAVPARLVAHDQRVGIALFKADLAGGYAATVLPTAPADAYQPGHLVLSVANPFGEHANPDPMVTVGMLSRVHPDDAEGLWRGCLQTDAGMTDGTVGAALVDVHGRLLGVATLWDPLSQGRNSGIGYGIPWARIEAALPRLKAGSSYVCNGYMGIGWSPTDDGAPKIDTVEPDSPAAKGGIQVGDVVVEIDGKAIQHLGEAVGRIRGRTAGETVKLVVRRAGKLVPLTVELGARPKPGP